MEGIDGGEATTKRGFAPLAKCSTLPRRGGAGRVIDQDGAYALALESNPPASFDDVRLFLADLLTQFATPQMR